jgi:hypothetical protein
VRKSVGVVTPTGMATRANDNRRRRRIDKLTIFGRLA